MAGARVNAVSAKKTLPRMHSQKTTKFICIFWNHLTISLFISLTLWWPMLSWPTGLDENVPTIWNSGAALWPLKVYSQQLYAHSACSLSTQFGRSVRILTEPLSEKYWRSKKTVLDGLPRDLLTMTHRWFKSQAPVRLRRLRRRWNTSLPLAVSSASSSAASQRCSETMKQRVTMLTMDCLFA